MSYDAFSLNGTWEMNYTYEAYTGETNPWTEGYVIENAVPGYWEEMADAFYMAPFHSTLQVNRFFGLQHYPMVERAPDMALPNIEGNFFYKRSFLWELSQSHTAEASGMALQADTAEAFGTKQRTDNLQQRAVSHSSNVALHFDGVQNAVSVWLNDVYLGRHEGYSAPFDFEIPEGVLKAGENVLVLSISNHRLEGFDGEPVSGLTSRAVNECTGGITGDVELRVYQSTLRDAAVLVSEDCRTVSVRVELEDSNNKIIWKVYDEGKVIKSGEAEGDFNFDAADLEYWSPEHPKLYTLEITCGDGKLCRSFGVRRLLPVGAGFELNGTPYYLRGICEHCYYPDTVHPPHDIAFYRHVIKTIKNLGFNFIRFHTYIPTEEYMQAADELGMLLHVESPNNATAQEYAEIVRFCRRHTSVVIYCCGNELLIDDAFQGYLKECADLVHAHTDGLFSPLSALRGLEYYLHEEKPEELAEEPFAHNPRRFKEVGAFSDMYSSYSLGHFSYLSMTADPKKVSDWHSVYGKPRVTHEICIDGTYIDLSLEERYKNSRIGLTQKFSSVRKHLEQKGLLQKAPLFFKNSSEWQRRVRKHCFEVVRKCENMAGYDFLGPIDTHWHTFGYDVGMMNEFYELKPGESVRNVRMYNAPTVLLTDLDTEVNFTAGEKLKFRIYASHYGTEDIRDGMLNVRLTAGEKVLERWTESVEYVKNGTLSNQYEFRVMLPKWEKPQAMKLYVSLDSGELFTENEWELYAFPAAEQAVICDASKKEQTVICHAAEKEQAVCQYGLEEDEAAALLQVQKSENAPIISNDISAESLIDALKAGKDVVLLGAGPFPAKDTDFRIALAGRTFGNLATVLYDHPILKDMPHEGFCGWQFKGLLTGAKAVCFEAENVAFDPIIEVASVHKCAGKQSALFEYRALNGRLLVCSLNFTDKDPAAAWLKAQIIEYVQSEQFAPKQSLDEQQLWSLIGGRVVKATADTNQAINLNDITALKRRK